MLGSRAVLVVEPHTDRERLADALRRNGMSVESAGDAGRALSLIESNHHAMIVVDPATPGMGGALLRDALRTLTPRPVVLVVVDGVKRPRGYGADTVHGFVRRSDSEQLAELIRDCLVALSGTGSQPVQPPAVSLRIPQ